MSELKEILNDVKIDEIKVIYPKNINKYYGSVTKTKSNTFQCSIRLTNPYYTFSKNYRTEQEALNCQIQKNIERKIVRNVLHCVYKNNILDHYEMELTQYEKTLIDIESFDIVDKYIFWLGGNKRYFSAITEIDNKTVYLHQLILGSNDDKEMTIDHIDRNPLNNKRSNLRWVNKKVQNINRGVQSNNTSGIKGVIFDKSSNAWRAIWCDNNKRCSKYFSCKKYGDNVAKQLAIEYRHKIENTLLDYIKAYNKNNTVYEIVIED